VCPKNHEGRAADDRPLFRRRFRRRHFIVEPSKLWVADIHFPSIFAGFLYFTVLLNARSRPGVRASLGVRHKGMPLPEIHSRRERRHPCAPRIWVHQFRKWG
jgi:hypothetical protein